MKIKYTFTIIVVGIALLFLVACNGVDSTGNDPLDGTSWTLMAYRKTSPIPGTVITAVFEDGRVRGSTGCNSYSGTYKVRGNNITVSEIIATEMACPEPEGVMQQETTFIQLLSEAESFQLTDGQLQTFAGHEALTFVPSAD
jgi:heat shock protein HslJ